MRKFLFIAVLLSFAQCMTTSERIGNYLTEIKRRTNSAYNSIGGVRGIKDALVNNLSPIGSKIKEHTRTIKTKINSIRTNSIVPKAKEIINTLKEKINKEKEKRKEEETEKETKDHPAEHAPEEDDEERMKGLEELLRNLIKSMKESGLDQPDSELTEDSHDQGIDNTPTEELTELEETETEKKDEFKKDL